MVLEDKASYLPGGYNENALVLLVQSPNVVFAYLELSENCWGVLLRHGQPVLRLYDVTDTAIPAGQPVTELELPPFTPNWYFRGLGGGRTYAADLGWRGGQGLFMSLLRSNSASTPTDRRAWTQSRRKMSTGLVPQAATPLTREEPETLNTDLPSSYTS